MPPQTSAMRRGIHRGPAALPSLLSRRLFLVLGAAGLLSACSAVGPKPGVATPPARLTRAGIIEAVNGVRQANGRPPLRYNSQLEAAARSQANLMASRDQLSHDLGVTLRQRVTAAGYDGAVGENVAGGQQTLEQAIQGWLNSPKHRDTLLSTRFTEFGLAVASVGSGKKSRYGTYWAFVAGGSFEAWKI
jgi:uncharacterized protein YkwD